MLILGDSLEELKKLDANSIDSVVTDPPYGLSFMGKKWDYDVPSVGLWREVIRVLKPGGHLLSFGGTRTYHRMVVNVEDAGFEIRDQIQWLYGSGFPKSHNLPGGIGTALKPANEPIVLARKPLEGTVAKNVEKWGCGGLNIDDCRISLSENEPDSRTATNAKMSCSNESWILANKADKAIEVYNKQGRWPANIILDEAAAEILDEQTQDLHGAGAKRSGGQSKQNQAGGLFGVGQHDGNGMRFGDSGGASRFFYCAKASKKERNAGLDGMVSKKQGAGPNSADPSGKFPDHDHRDSGGNNHPTVKPIKLMEYLCKLITPPNGTILDPFMGSGSTGVASKNLGFKFIGIELQADYFEISKKRVGE